MALTPGLSASIRQPAPEPAEMPEASDIVVEDAAPEGDKPVTDDAGNTIRIEHDDGSITIALDGMPLAGAETGPSEWFDNLVDQIDAAELARIADDLLRGIDEDQESRKDWLEARADGLKLLGLKPETPGIGASADGAAVEGISRIRHPLLLEAVLRFQANARSELLPTDGPVKVRDDGNGSTPGQDELANALQKDLNHYLTATATEYYPDTDRMLLMLGFGGTAFKKVYFCPLRNRPVSETVDAEDLIVNNDATDLRNAKRVTHRIMMRPSVVRRLQILGAYRDIPLSTPLAASPDAVQMEKKNQAGIAPDTTNPDDRDREIFECTCELDIKGFEHKLRGAVTGLEIPYRVTIDVSSREVLSIIRAFEEPEGDDLPELKLPFVKYTFVPGFGFYDIGLLNILGNTTNAITAAWREMLDMGMFANFPGFLFADTGARQNTNIFRVPPGGGASVKTNGLPINQAIMALPYSTAGMPALMTLTDNIAQTGQRIGGTSEQMVGEGRADAPVGTTLAMIEQAQKILNSVHKRMHAAQAEEFQLLVQVFREHPESFWQRKRKRAYPWDQATFLAALDDCELVPQADPNTASHTQRLMKIAALKMLQQASPTLYDPIKIDQAAMRALGWSNPEQFMAPPAALNAPPPELLKEQAAAAAAAKTADARMLDAQTGARELELKEQQGGLGAAASGPTPQELAIKERAEQTRAEQVRFQQQRAGIEDENRDKDRAADLAIERMQFIIQDRKLQEEQAHDHALIDHETAAQHALTSAHAGEARP